MIIEVTFMHSLVSENLNHYGYIVDWFAVVFHLFTLLIIARYLINDKEVRLSCLPIAIILNIVMTCLMLFQSLFMMFKFYNTNSYDFT